MGQEGKIRFSKIVLFVLTKAAIIQSIMSSLCIESMFSVRGFDILYSYRSSLPYKHVNYFRSADKYICVQLLSQISGSTTRARLTG